jgi:hypothetical protein
MTSQHSVVGLNSFFAEEETTKMGYNSKMLELFIFSNGNARLGGGCASPVVYSW